ncbi:MAG: tRNA-splicing endonuclease subunit sen54, partial [Pleopsidium flavum]
MADADEDNSDSTSQNPDLTDLTDETQDFRFLSTLSQSLPPADSFSLTTTPNAHPTIPRRGEKDFEPHGTTHQAHTLASSRHAMHTALSHPRYHVPKSHIIGHFDPESGMTVVERAR